MKTILKIAAAATTICIPAVSHAGLIPTIAQANVESITNLEVSGGAATLSFDRSISVLPTSSSNDAADVSLSATVSAVSAGTLSPCVSASACDIFETATAEAEAMDGSASGSIQTEPSVFLIQVEVPTVFSVTLETLSTAEFTSLGDGKNPDAFTEALTVVNFLLEDLGGPFREVFSLNANEQRTFNLGFGQYEFTLGGIRATAQASQGGVLVSEPASFALLGVGLAGLALSRGLVARGLARRRALR